MAKGRILAAAFNRQDHIGVSPSSVVRGKPDTYACFRAMSRFSSRMRARQFLFGIRLWHRLQRRECVRPRTTPSLSRRLVRLALNVVRPAHPPVAHAAGGHTCADAPNSTRPDTLWKSHVLLIAQIT